MVKKPLVFLGGTSGRNPWRRELIQHLVARGFPEALFFDPVVEDWNEEARKREEQAKAQADLLVFYLGDPQEPSLPLSAFTLVEATLAVCQESHRTLVVFDLDAVDGHARKVYRETAKLLRAQRSGATIVDDLSEAEEEIVKSFQGTYRGTPPEADETVKGPSEVR